MQVMPSGGQIWNLCNWRHLVVKFGINMQVAKLATNASGAIWWTNLQPIQEVSLKSISNYSSWDIYSSYGLNTLGPLCLWQCFSVESISNTSAYELETFSTLSVEMFQFVSQLRSIRASGQRKIDTSVLQAQVIKLSQCFPYNLQQFPIVLQKTYCTNFVSFISLYTALSALEL